MPDVFKIKGMRLEGIMIDTLHAVDQGLASHVIANVFVEIMALGHWALTKRPKLRAFKKRCNPCIKCRTKQSRLRKSREI